MPPPLSHDVLHRLRRAVFVCVCAGVFAGTLVASPAQAGQVSSHTDRAQRAATQFRHAETLQRRLLARPQDVRTQNGYEAVLDAYRAVYHGDPAAQDAPKSVAAVAALLQREGRQFNDPKDFRDAVGQYEFLRQQYPTSPLRYHALLAEAEIERGDLHDARAADRMDREFLHLYPHNALAAQARAGLNADRNAATHPALQRTATRSGVAFADMSGSRPQPGRRQQAVAARANGPTVHAAASKEIFAAQAAEDAPKVRSAAITQAAITQKPSAPPTTLESIRYWSTGSYTRVALDLGRAVAFQSSLAGQPDRIVFHLADTRPSTALLMQPMMVRNDNFLRAIRVQREAGSAVQVSLEVSSASDYSAFLLPNPVRLIIDIHARRSGHALPSAQGKAASSIAAPTQEIAQATTPSWAAQPPATPRRDPLRPVAAVAPASDPELRSALPPPATSPIRPTSVVAHALVIDGTEETNGATSNMADEGANDTANRYATVPAVQGPSETAVHPSAGAAGTANVAGSSASPERNAVLHAAMAQSVPKETGPLTQIGTGSSLSRVLGLKIHRIVIDAGHGGHDSGTLGPHGLEEKNVVLDVALRLGKLLQDRLGAEVVYTRRDDTFVPLETRTAIANQAQADLFLSIHANSSRDRSARGVETYFLNFTASPGALAVAARENAVSNKSVYELSDLVRKIALSDKVDESRTFAMDVQRSLYEGLEEGNPGLHDRGVKQAPFVVLIGANMPSILAEISFLTNPQDAAKLRRPAYRQRIAEALYQGVAGYVDSMGGVRVAENTNRSGR
ncbi:MAG: N-acetylmuramoyl-L-alanine amidase [Acidobacteriaceae bacterium]